MHSFKSSYYKIYAGKWDCSRPILLNNPDIHRIILHFVVNDNVCSSTWDSLVWLKINWFPACSLQFRQLVFSWDIIDWGLLFRSSTVFLQFHPCHLRLLALWNSRHHDKCLWHSDISLFKRKIFPARSKHTTEDILVVMVICFICMIFLVFIGLLPLSNIAEVEFVFFSRHFLKQC